ncbi:MAG TPA: hypothetical protein VGD19_10355 [Allosphingosinicella sp.]|jgi:hypothetical protein
MSQDYKAVVPTKPATEQPRRRRRPPAARQKRPTNALTEAEYRFIAVHHLDKLTNGRNTAASQVARQTGSLIAQIVVLNGAALIVSFANVDPHGPGAAATRWFLAGVILAILSGALALLHAAITFRQLERMADPEMFLDPEKWPAANPRLAHGGRAASYLAIAAAMISLGAFTAGLLTWTTPPPAPVVSPAEQAIDILLDS